MKTQPYHIVLPNLTKKTIGTQGEAACFLPYRKGLTLDGITAELARQPHMAPLLRHLDGKRRLYLLDGDRMELLLLAAEYIAAFHHLTEPCEEGVCEDYDGLDGEEGTEWEDGDVNRRSFDFSAGIPFLMDQQLQSFYFPDEGFGFGGHMYRPDLTPQKNPWWTLCPQAPLIVSTADPGQGLVPFPMSLSGLPRLLQAMEERPLIILLTLRPPGADSGGDGREWVTDFSPMSMDDLSFELETDCIRLNTPGQESRYKRDILRQLARERNAPLLRGASALKILSLVEEHRGDMDNRTIAKAVSNALLRRKTQGPLRERDFAYLSSLFPGRKVQAEEKEENELVGQADIRRQLERVADSMAFQKRRHALGLPCSSIHYTFAFIGPPGTGKTSWAMWLAREMARRDLLRDTSFIAINAAELKAKYVGHTTGKVKALFQQYSVILLDEAYSLAEGNGDDCFAREALAQLCVELENHREDRLVIFAGYGGSSDAGDNRMLHFLQSNPGIHSRVSFQVHFPPLEPEALAGVFRSMLEREQFRLPPEALPIAEEFFRRRMGDRAFGNCREARNLADRVKLQLAARQEGLSSCTREQLSQILPRDVEGASAEILEEFQLLAQDRERRIGFLAPGG